MRQVEPCLESLGSWEAQDSVLFCKLGRCDGDRIDDTQGSGRFGLDDRLVDKDDSLRLNDDFVNNVRSRRVDL